MYIILTILIGIILLALFGLGNIGTIALFSNELENDEERKIGCSVFGFVIVVLVILLLILCGLRSCV